MFQNIIIHFLKIISIKIINYIHYVDRCSLSKKYHILTNDKYSNYLNIFGLPEKNNFECLRKIFFNKFKNQIALDIGANLGIYSDFFSHFFKKVYAFEPSNIAYPILKLNVKKKNVILFNYGLSNKNKNYFFKESSTNISAGKIFNSGNLIKCFKIDTFIKLNKIRPIEIGFVKIDTENQEIYVLMGAINFLKQTKSIIGLEIRSKLNFFKTKIYRLLFKYNYKYFYIAETVNKYNNSNFSLNLINLERSIKNASLIFCSKYSLTS
jgi:FkbM family methyltransferase